jgi:hypothetical protein
MYWWTNEQTNKRTMERTNNKGMNEWVHEWMNEWMNEWVHEWKASISSIMLYKVSVSSEKSQCKLVGTND